MKRVLRTTFAALLIMVLCIGMLAPVASATETTTGQYVKADLTSTEWMPVTVNVTGSTPKAGTTITFEITALTEGAPAPTESIVTEDLKAGSTTYYLGFPINQMGVFKYQVTVTDCSYTVDAKTYIFEVYSLADGYDNQVNCYNESGVKCDAIYNIYLKELQIVKMWYDQGSVRPAYIWVDLLLGDQVIDTIKLSAATDWKGVFTGLDAALEYTVDEHKIPGYSASYKYDAATGVCTITNVGSLLQTGQLNWPIPVLAATGMVFVALGFLMLRKKEEKNA